MLAGFFVLAALGAVGIIVPTFRDKDNGAAARSVHEAPTAGQSADGPSESALLQAERLKLVGRWRRSDANYVLEIRSIAADGTIDAAYLNPKPIHVSRAVAGSESGKTTVMVELRDRLYPGSYYTLTYNASTDCLSGVYHHLGIRQDFDVVLMRMERK